jgi:hypothetical protein
MIRKLSIQETLEFFIAAKKRAEGDDFDILIFFQKIKISKSSPSKGFFNPFLGR